MTSVQYIRTSDGKFQCPHCPKICAKQNTMYYHMQTKHIQDYKFVCEHCDNGTRGFVQRSAYLQHIATAHPETVEDAKENQYAKQSFSCCACDHSAKTKAQVIVHYARTHCKEVIPAYSKSEACKVCEKEFASSTAYFYHSVNCYRTPDIEAMLGGL